MIEWLELGRKHRLECAEMGMWEEDEATWKRIGWSVREWWERNGAWKLYPERGVEAVKEIGEYSRIPDIQANQGKGADQKQGRWTVPVT